MNGSPSWRPPLAGHYRPDIDGLRAVAILPVVAFHGFASRLPVPGGFVGVDVFFVISGYLLTGILARELAEGRFSLASFYSRRVRRIFPALALVLVSVLVAGWFLLDRRAYAALGAEVAAGAGFGANLLFWSQAGYFDTASHTKPLLHLWSLGVEEQFYFALPLLLWASWRRGPLRVVVGLLVASFALCLWLSYRDVTQAFYSPLSRAWELLLGSAVAMAPVSIHDRRARELVAGGGLVAILATVAILTPQIAFPGAVALLPTIGAAAIIVAAPGTVVGRLLSSDPAVRIGTISYPLYLWHWPLLVFPRLIYSDETPAWVRAASVLASVVLAWATHRLLELPVRQSVGRVVPWLCGAVVVPALAGLLVFWQEGVATRAAADTAIADQLTWPYISRDDCLRRFGTPDLDGWWFCIMSGPEPSVALLGNSHANQLYPGLIGQRIGVVNIGSCDPLDGVRMEREDHEKNPCRDGRGQVATDFALGAIGQIPSLRYAVVASSWPDFAGGGWRYVAGDMNQRQAYYRGLSRYLSRVEAMGLEVILALDAPALDRDPRACVARVSFGARSDCTVPVDQVLAAQEAFRSMLPRLRADHPKLKVFDPLPAFCDATTCRMVRDGLPLMRDKDHLSRRGSEVWARAFVDWLDGAEPVAGGSAQ